MLIATATGVQTRKLAMLSLGGAMLSPRRRSRKSKIAQSRLNSLAPAIIRQRRVEDSSLIFVQKSEKGGLKICKPRTLQSTPRRTRFWLRQKIWQFVEAAAFGRV